MENKETTKKFLTSTARNVTRMVDLINDLDEITKLESGEQTLHKEKFIIQEAIRETYETLAQKAQEKKIVLSIKKGCEQPVEVMADKEKSSVYLSTLLIMQLNMASKMDLLQPAFTKQMIKMCWWR